LLFSKGFDFRHAPSRMAHLTPFAHPSQGVCGGVRHTSQTVQNQSTVFGKSSEEIPMATAVESTEEIKRRIGELNLEHRDLDRAIEALEQNPLHDELQLKRLKKRKLMLKDQIFMLQRQLVPDIPA
jgi:hypothetical protein